MTTGAVIMMVVTMSVVLAFVVYFFLKVVRSPLSKNGNGEEKA